MFRQLTLAIVQICIAGSFATSCTADRIGLDRCRISDAEPRPVMIYSQPNPDADIAATPVFNPQQSLDRIEISENEKWIKIKHKDYLGWVRSNLLDCRPEPQLAQSVIEPTSKRLMEAIKENDWHTISQMAHPTKGIRFSPYGEIASGDEQKVKANELLAEIKSSKKRVWGSHPGSADLIILSLADYIKKFVAAHPYWSSNEIAYNGTSTSTYVDNSILERYRHSISVAYRIPLDSTATGLTWSSLIFVFDEYGGKWFVVGFVHADSIT